MRFARWLVVGAAACLIAAPAVAVTINVGESVTVASGFLDESGPDKIGCFVAGGGILVTGCSAENSTDSVSCVAVDEQEFADTLATLNDSSKVTFSFDNSSGFCGTIRVDNQNVFP